MKLIYNVKDKPKFGQVLIFAFQLLLAIMAATIVVPSLSMAILQKTLQTELVLPAK